MCGFFAVLHEDSGKTNNFRSFWRGVWGETFFPKRSSPDYFFEREMVFPLYAGAGLTSAIAETSMK